MKKVKKFMHMCSFKQCLRLASFMHEGPRSRPFHGPAGDRNRPRHDQGLFSSDVRSGFQHGRFVFCCLQTHLALSQSLPSPRPSMETPPGRCSFCPYAHHRNPPPPGPSDRIGGFLKEGKTRGFWLLVLGASSGVGPSPWPCSPSPLKPSTTPPPLEIPSTFTPCFRSRISWATDPS